MQFEIVFTYISLAQERNEAGFSKIAIKILTVYSYLLTTGAREGSSFARFLVFRGVAGRRAVMTLTRWHTT
jgi:hypothetical protein